MNLDDLDFAANLIKKQTKLYQYKPYPWQLDFHKAGRDNPERMIMAANRVGKTWTAACETAYHLTGLYPDWWEGRRFDTGILVWTGAVTNEASRDIIQKELLGGSGEALGTGLIPRKLIVGKPQNKQAGISDVVDKVRVRHASGEISECVFKTYDQGWRKWQGTAPHVVWMDEEPDENYANEKRIYSEAQTRVITTQGLVYITFTPLLGETDIVRHFHEGVRGTYLKNVTWDNAPHLNKDELDRLKSSYPDHELQTRASGVPMMGEGRVFPISEEDIRCEPFEIPRHYARIAGLDFGFDHPFATVWIAWDRDRDIFFVYDTYRVSGLTAAGHAPVINRRGTWIPVSWPHDGMDARKDGVEHHKHYRKEGVNMLSMSARYHKDKAGAQPVEPIVMDFIERMRDGRFKVFKDQDDWFEEFRSYHRKDGKIVDKKDDLMKATMYAAMMRRYATTEPSNAQRARFSRPILKSVA